MLRRFSKLEKGQTLIDVIIAMALLSSTVASAGAISTLSSRVGDEAGRRSQAMALAERDLEGLREYRAEVMLTPGKTWADVFTNAVDSSGNPCTSNFVMQVDATGWKPALCGLGHVSTFANAEASAVSYSGVNILDTIDPSIAVNYQAFSRLDIVQQNVNPATGVTDPNSEIVEVIVVWNEGNGMRSVQLNTVLANWRQ
ncbi:MAG: hypothetical protein ACHQUB_02420 [Candidatus Saccharimonadia bacterium]